jgi:hypothetical protein
MSSKLKEWRELADDHSPVFCGLDGPRYDLRRARRAIKEACDHIEELEAQLAANARSFELILGLDNEQIRVLKALINDNSP